MSVQCSKQTDSIVSKPYHFIQSNIDVFSLFLPSVPGMHHDHASVPAFRRWRLGHQLGAVWFCAWCFGADTAWEPRCDAHAAIYRQAADDDAVVIRAVNSPCVGMCGYNGPAEPPY